jgi:hypothetical protein
MRILRLIEPYILIGVSKLGDPEPENLGSDVCSNSSSSLLHITLQTVQLITLAHSEFENMSYKLTSDVAYCEGTCPCLPSLGN